MTWKPEDLAKRGYDLIAQEKFNAALEEALEYTRRFEPPGVRDTLRVEESEALEKRPEDPKGVYWFSGHIFSAET